MRSWLGKLELAKKNCSSVLHLQTRTNWLSSAGETLLWCVGTLLSNPPNHLSSTSGLHFTLPVSRLLACKVAFPQLLSLTHPPCTLECCVAADSQEFQRRAETGLALGLGIFGTKVIHADRLHVELRLCSCKATDYLWPDDISKFHIKSAVELKLSSSIAILIYGSLLTTSHDS